MCVCVKHLNRCKTSTVIIFSCDLLRFTFSFRLFNVPLQSFVFIMSNQFSEDTAGGWSVNQKSPANEDASVFTVI